MSSGQYLEIRCWFDQLGICCHLFLEQTSPVSESSITLPCRSNSSETKTIVLRRTTSKLSALVLTPRLNASPLASLPNSLTGLRRQAELSTMLRNSTRTSNEKRFSFRSSLPIREPSFRPSLTRRYSIVYQTNRPIYRLESSAPVPVAVPSSQDRSQSVRLMIWSTTS